MSDSVNYNAVLQAPLSMGLSRQEYWSGLPCIPPGDLLNPGIKPTSFMSPALAGGFFTTGTTWEAQRSMRAVIFTVARTTSSIFSKLRLTNGFENFCTLRHQSMYPFPFNLFRNKVFLVELNFRSLGLVPEFFKLFEHFFLVNS